MSTGRDREMAGGRGEPALPVLHRPLQGPYSSMYGSDIVTARYCGFSTPPCPPLGLWMHGWYPEARALDRPERLFDVSMAHLPGLQYWVTTERQAAFLRGLGYAHAKAIGLPLVYVPLPRVPRRAGSLLVMPAHSLPAHDRSWATSEYVESIRALVPAFASITVCVNGHDWDRGNWVKEFSQAGFEVIRGAGDETTLYKMAALFSEYEYVTTNGFGSLIAYASAFGAKASFHGPFSEVPADTLRNVPFFMDNPELMAAESACCEEQYCRATFPGFFCHPAEAEAHVEWGRREIGWGNRVPPDELKRLFGWSAAGRARSKIEALEKRVVTSIPDRAKEAAAALTSPAARARRRERRRLQQMPPGVPGVTPLFGRVFEFTDAAAYLQTYDDCFSREVYRFRALSREPLVVDLCPGSGLAVLYFKILYPRCRIVAIETREAENRLLRRNCRQYALEDVEIIPGGAPGDPPHWAPERLAEELARPSAGSAPRLARRSRPAQDPHGRRRGSDEGGHPRPPRGCRERDRRGPALGGEREEPGVAGDRPRGRRLPRRFAVAVVGSFASAPRAGRGRGGGRAGHGVRRPSLMSGPTRR